MILAKQSFCVPARFASLATLLDPLAERASDPVADMAARATLLRAQTVVEELFANSIHHGYQGESDNSVWLEIEAGEGVLRIRYADAAAPHDPLADLTGTIGRDDEAHLRVGGIGHRLVSGLPDRCRYQRRNGHNELELEFDCKA